MRRNDNKPIGVQNVYVGWMRCTLVYDNALSPQKRVVGFYAEENVRKLQKLDYETMRHEIGFLFRGHVPRRLDERSCSLHPRRALSHPNLCMVSSCPRLGLAQKPRFRMPCFKVAGPKEVSY